MRLRWIVIYGCCLLLVVVIVFTLSFMFPDDGLAFQWEAWPIW